MGFKELFSEALTKGPTEQILIQLKASYNKLEPNSKKIIINKLNELIRKSKPNSASAQIYRALDVIRYYEELEKMINDKSEEIYQNAIEKCVWLNNEKSIQILSRRFETGSDSIKHAIVQHCINKDCEQAVELIIKYFPKLTVEEKTLFISNLSKYSLKRELISSFLLDLLNQKVFLTHVFDLLPIFADSKTIDALIIKLYSSFGILHDNILKVLKIVDYQRFGIRNLNDIFAELPDATKKSIEIALFDEIINDFDAHNEIQMELQSKFKKYSSAKTLPKIMKKMIETTPELDKRKIFELVNSARTEKAVFAASVLSELSGLESHQAIANVLKNNYRTYELKKFILSSIEIPKTEEICELYFDVLITTLRMMEKADEQNGYNFFVNLYDRVVGVYSERFLRYAEENKDNFTIVIKKKLIQYISRYSEHSDIENIIELLRSEEKTIIESTLKDLGKASLNENQLIRLFRAFSEYERKYHEKIFKSLKKHIPNEISDELADQLFILASSVSPEIMIDVLVALSGVVKEKIDSQDIFSVYMLIHNYVNLRPHIREEFERSFELNIKYLVEHGIRLDKMYLDLYFKFPFLLKYFIAYIETQPRTEAIIKLKESVKESKIKTTKELIHSFDKKFQAWITMTLIGHLKKTSSNLITMSAKIDILNLFIEMDNNMILFEIMELLELYKSDEWLNAILKVIESIHSSLNLDILINIIKKLISDQSNLTMLAKPILLLFDYSKYWGYYWAFEVFMREDIYNTVFFNLLKDKSPKEYIIAFHDFFKDNSNKQMNLKLLHFMNKLIQFGISIDGLRLLPKYDPKKYIELYLEDSPLSKDIVVFLENSDVDCGQIIASFIQIETNENNKIKLLNLKARIKSGASQPSSAEILL